MQAQISPYGKEEVLFYEEHLYSMEQTMQTVIDYIGVVKSNIGQDIGHDPIEHIKARIKSASSMKDKLVRKELEPTIEHALKIIKDSIGIRIVCTFISDVYECARLLEDLSGFTVVEVKDYIRDPKPNGYRSYHMILRQQFTGYHVEIQLRTIAMDCWAALEHQMKYKKKISNEKLLEKELKRCADEMASTDLSLEAMRDLIQMEE